MSPISAAAENAVRVPVRRVRTFRYWAISIIYVAAFALAVVALAGCSYSVYAGRSVIAWKAFFALFGTGAISGTFGGYLMAVDQREFNLVREQEALDIARFREEEALEVLRDELREHPDDGELRRLVFDLLGGRAAARLK